MKKMVIFFSILFILIACSASSTGIDTAYVEALEALLEKKDVAYDIDYFSFFMNDLSISERRIEMIKSYFNKQMKKPFSHILQTK